MKIAIDTNRYRDFCTNDPATVDRLQTAERISLPFVTLAELRAGFLCGTQARANERTLVQFLHRPRVAVLYPSETTIHHYALLYHENPVLPAVVAGPVDQYDHRVLPPPCRSRIVHTSGCVSSPRGRRQAMGNSQLRRQGTPIPANDLWIAALVVEHDLLLFSRDHHFDHLPRLP